MQVKLPDGNQLRGVTAIAASSAHTLVVVGGRSEPVNSEQQGRPPVAAR